jgi:hypothetical protein
MEHLTRALIAAGALLLIYALLGNYVALPGYVRFLERGGTSAAGNTFDLDVLIGAVKTIVWMFSFQLGVLSIALAYALRQRLHAAYLGGGGILWVCLWAWPTLPKPGAWFYVLFGTILLICITLVLLRAGAGASNRLSRTINLAAIVFFAFATWEVCGLGSTGRMLHPDEAASPLAHNILVTQSSKLMIEFVLAWSLMLASLLTGRIPDG